MEPNLKNEVLIELKTDLNEEWLVRLKRKSSNKSLEPSPSDQRLIITPDKKFRKVTREEISSN